MKVKTGLRAGKLAANHSRVGLAVKTGIKGGKLSANHNRPALKVTTGLKGGKIDSQPQPRRAQGANRSQGRHAWRVD